MNPVDAAEVLGRALREDRLVALVGSHASTTSVADNGRQYEGLPTPAGFVESCAGQIGYIDSDDSFNVACDKLVDREGRAKLEELLLRYYQVPEAFSPPPAHQLLSWLPFSFYLTSNYDEFIERSLEHEGRLPHRLVENIDLRALKQRRHTPVVKYHGCVRRPDTMVAASTDYSTLERKRRLVRDFVAANLAGKTLLVVGHGLADSDLSRIIEGIDEQLGEYRPSIFVLRPPGHDGRLPGLNFEAEVVTEDLTDFLARLLQEARRREPGAFSRNADDRWLSSAFFATLKQAASLPSETQVIDAFLSHLQDEISARSAVSEVLDDADTAIQLALDTRPNYEAVRKTWEHVTTTLRPHTETASAELAIQGIRDEREAKKAHFRRLGANLLRPNDRILVYSQSQRVVQALLGVPQATQKSIHLFIAECRPKSPSPYQDAAALSQQLADTYYLITVCPDVVAGHLLQTHQITRFLMGTHAVFQDPDTSELHSFVNTCGASGLAEIARSCDVPVEVIGEDIKIEAISREASRDHVHLHEESDLLDSAVGLRDMATRRGAVEHMNIGYDLIRNASGVSVHLPDREDPAEEQSRTAVIPDQQSL